MKKLFLFLLILPLAFVACGDDDDDPDYSEAIVGTWNFSKVTKATFETNNNLVNAALKEALKGTDLNDFSIGYDGVFEFNADGTYLAKERNPSLSQSESGTYTLSGSTLNLVPHDDSPHKCTINISGNKMQMTVSPSKAELAEIEEELREESGISNLSITKASITVELTK